MRTLNSGDKISDPGESGEVRLGRAFVRNMLPLGLLLAAFLLVAWHAGPADTLAAIRSVSLPTLALMLSASLFNYAARSLRWFLMVRLTAPRAPESALRALPRQLVVYLAGFAFTLTPGRAGEAVRAWIARKSFDTPVATGLSLVIADRFHDAIALAIILLVAAAMHGGFSVAAGVTIAVLAAAIPLAGWLPRSDLWRRAAHAVPRLSRHITGLQSAIALRDMGFDLGIRDSVFMFALATLIGGASFLPGGLGGFEATMIALLAANGVPVATALAATLLVRFTTLWLGVALGIATLALWSRNLRRAGRPGA